MKSKIGAALLALCISFGLWLYVISEVSPESEQTYYNIPVVFSGNSVLESRGLKMTSDKDVRVELTLSGTRKDLNKLNSSNITIIADLSGITTAGEHVIHYTISYPASAGAGGFTVLNQSPQQITVQVTQWEEKDVPVKVGYEGSLPSGDFILDRQNAVLDHSSVTISGPKDVVDQVKHASVTVHLDGRREDFTESCPITLCDADGKPVEGAELVNKNLEAVNISLKVTFTKTIDIVVGVIPGGGLNKDNVVIEQDRVSLMISGPESVLKTLNRIELPLDLSQITKSCTLSYPIELPEGVTNVTGVSHVNVTVKIPELTTTVVTVDSSLFQCIRVPEDMDYVFLTESLEISVRGREDQLRNLTADNIIVTIDMRSATEGRQTFEVKIQIVDVENVGVIYEDTRYEVTVEFTSRPADQTP